jgi:hypothetical protein
VSIWKTGCGPIIFVETSEESGCRGVFLTKEGGRLMGGQFICYDVRGIQDYIFAIPKLRYIVGGSALIDQLDRERMPEIGKQAGIEHIAGGGGRGTFHCENEAARQRLVDRLIAAAHDLGLDLRIGHGADLKSAVMKADDLYAFVHEDLAGEPCPVSGLYPTQDPSKPHTLVAKRLEVRDRIQDDILERLKSRLESESDLDSLNGYVLAFPSNVSAEDPESTAAARAFGAAGRWAVVAMDGNEIGRQHRIMAPVATSDEAAYLDWLRAMSRALDDCTREAFVDAVILVLRDWLADGDAWRAALHGKKLFLPFRPLVLGGDDILCLTHPSYAMRFAAAVAERFSIHSKCKAEAAAPAITLWPATNGQLSISAGILYARFTYPLHSAIGYVETLLAGAKAAYRGASDTGPPPASVDWEHVTDGLLDTPGERRRRTLMFHDDDIGETVSLTARPWTVAAFQQVECDLMNLIATEPAPRSVLHGMAADLRCGFWGRFAFRARLAKNHPLLCSWLDEQQNKLGRGWDRKSDGKGGTIRALSVLDILSHREEEHRQTRAAVEGGAS